MQRANSDDGPVFLEEEGVEIARTEAGNSADNPDVTNTVWRNQQIVLAAVA